MSGVPIDVAVTGGAIAILGNSSGKDQAGDTGIGVNGVSDVGDGVLGQSTQGRGVYGYSEHNAGVVGFSPNEDGVRGSTNSPAHAAISAVNDHGGFGVWSRASTSGHFEGRVEIIGQAGSDALQVHGKAHFGDSIAVVGAPIGPALGVLANQNGQPAASFEGTVLVNGNLVVGKNFDIILSDAGDCAEVFPAANDGATEPGTVVVVDGNGALRPCGKPYDRCVVGVVSGAGGLRPGLILGTELVGTQRTLVALTGRVYVKVDASVNPVECGDLLTTSARSGHAMKAADPLKAFGTVIGKALAQLESGQGLLPVLVTLQ
jgi:hypothetical protein